MAIVISSINLKGGVGKTTLAKYLGMTYAIRGKRILIIDLCQNSGVITRFGYNRYGLKYDSRDFISGLVPFENIVVHDEETGIDILPGSNMVDKIQSDAESQRAFGYEWKIKESLESIKDRYDYIIFDTHPTETNRIVIMTMIASDYVLIPCVLDKESVNQTERTHTLLQQLKEQKIKVDYKVVMMAVDYSRGMQLPLDKVCELFESLGIPLTNTKIRYSTTIMKESLEEIMDEKKPKKSSYYYQNVMEDFGKLADEVESELAVKG